MTLKTAVVALAFSVISTPPVSAALINNQLNQGWASFRDLTSAGFSAKFTQYRDAGYRMIDIDAYPNGSGLLYSQVWEKNSDKRRGLSPTRFRILPQRVEPALCGDLGEEHGGHRLVLASRHDQLSILILLHRAEESWPPTCRHRSLRNCERAPLRSGLVPEHGQRLLGPAARHVARHLRT